MYLLAFLLILLAVSVTALAQLSGVYEPRLLVGLALVLLFVKLKLLSKIDNLKWFAPDFFFLLGFFFLNFSLPMLEILGETAYRVVTLKNVTLTSQFVAVHYSIYAMAAFLVGSIWIKRPHAKIGKASQHGATANCPTLDLCVIVSALTVILLVSFIMVAGVEYFTGQYKGVYARTGLANIIFYSLQLLGTSSGILLLMRIEKKGIFNSSIEVTLVMPYLVLMLLYLMSGDRGELIYLVAPLVFFLISRRVSSSRFPSVVLILFLLIALIAVGALRDLRGFEAGFFAFIPHFIKNVSFVASIQAALTNIGSSGLLLAAAIDDVIDNGLYIGAFSLNAFLGILPGFRGALSKFFGYGDNAYVESSNLLTDRLLGEGSSSGVGTSTIADFYLDFGLVGIIIGHLLLGMVAGRIRFLANSNNFWFHRYIFLISLGVFVVIARYSPLSMLVKYILFPVVLIYSIETIRRYMLKLEKRSA